MATAEKGAIGASSETSSLQAAASVEEHEPVVSIEQSRHFAEDGELAKAARRASKPRGDFARASGRDVAAPRASRERGPLVAAAMGTTAEGARLARKVAGAPIAEGTVAEAVAAQSLGSYSVGQRVSIFSQSAAKWKLGEVVALAQDGAVQVYYAGKQKTVPPRSWGKWLRPAGADSDTDEEASVATSLQASSGKRGADAKASDTDGDGTLEGSGVVARQPCRLASPGDEGKDHSDGASFVKDISLWLLSLGLQSNLPAELDVQV